jgi:hypothetical protein
MDYTIRIVEHSATAVVSPGDPAYDLCRELRRIGYKQIVMPLRTFATGKVCREYIATEAGIVVEDLIDAEEQMAALAKGEEDV